MFCTVGARVSNGNRPLKTSCRALLLYYYINTIITTEDMEASCKTVRRYGTILLDLYSWGERTRCNLFLRLLRVVSCRFLTNFSFFWCFLFLFLIVDPTCTACWFRSRPPADWRETKRTGSQNVAPGIGQSKAPIGSAPNPPDHKIEAAFLLRAAFVTPAKQQTSAYSNIAFTDSSCKSTERLPRPEPWVSWLAG